MQKLTIAVAQSRRAKVWQNKEVSWEEFVDLVKTTRRTAETVIEYRLLPKAEQDRLKDIGGFVAAFLKNGSRKKGFVEYRSMLTLDMDYAEPNIWDKIILKGYTCLIYSTHKHTPEKPRLRLVIPLCRNVTPDEYSAVARMVTFDIGIDMFDDTTYEINRLMYYPSTSTDGEFVFREQNANLLNPDDVLSKYADWRNTREHPVSSRQNTTIKQSISKQKDPLTKSGVIGAFCRTYTIIEAIDTFLSDVYELTLSENRYSYIPADSTSGLIIYDDKFCYSHHATDPACGKTCNAFDIVRIHKYGELDSETAGDTPPSKLPSFIAMQEFCTNDNEVKKQLISDRQDEVKSDFKNEDEWQTKLNVDKNGKICNTLKNLITIIQNDPKLKSIVFNELSDGMEIKGDVPWKHPAKFWRDADDAQLISYIDLTYGSFSNKNYNIAVTKVADDRSYHPIKEYLNSLPPWDGVPRAETLLIDYLGSEDCEYTRAVTKISLCAAIARINKPGIKYDTMLVLCGPQGIGKSTLISKLGGEWFSDSLQLSDTHDKTAAEKLQGYWLFEIGELAGLKKADVEILRSFLTRQNDIYRASFGKRATPHPRQCVFFGTTNAENGYLRDVTGNRRFYPIKTPSLGTKKVWDITDDDIKQIWAEVLEISKAVQSLVLDDSLAEIAKEAQREAMETDERESMVFEYLETELPKNWSKMNIYERRSYLNGTDFPLNERTVDASKKTEKLLKRDKICNMEIWFECFDRDRASLKRQDANEIAAIMAKMKGWQKMNSKTRFGEYGVILGYERVD